MVPQERAQDDARAFIPFATPARCSISDISQHCAQTLLDFNGGASCVQVYVNQHDFFINRVKKSSEAEDAVLYASSLSMLHRVDD